MEGDECKALRNFTCAKLAYARWDKSGRRRVDVVLQGPASESEEFHRALSTCSRTSRSDGRCDAMTMQLCCDDIFQVPALHHFERAAEIDPTSSSVVNALAVVRGDT
eukprot:646008-Hanusia_phi.AAC.1